MNTIKKFFFSLLFMCLGMPCVIAQSRRPIDNKHPMWIVHVDIWNNANPQNVIDLIPEDIKPYVVFNLSLSCAYDKEKNVYTRPQNALLTYESWASVCCANNVWFTCQPASGGHTHIRDDAEHFQEALDIHESFFKKYPNFLGWNYAEQFWGFGEPGDASSSKENDRLKLFAKLVPIHHKYGGFLTISYCGSIYHQNMNPVAMLKRNTELYNACKQYPEACLWLYKYTHSACFYNNESTTMSPFISGLATNYGVRYDNCGFNEGMDVALDHKKISWKGTYPNSLGFGTVMEQMCINGGAVWDGPELIWREECFIGDNDMIDAEGYRVRRLKRTPSMNNGWVELFRKVIDGTIPVPTRSEVINDVKIALVNNNDETTPPYDFYTGLYKQTDPMNYAADNNAPNGDGDGDNNRWFLKSTGRYRAVPYLLSSDVPSSISIKKNHTDIGGWSSKMTDFNSQYPEVSTGDLFVARRNNLLVTYYPYSYFNEKTTASAVVPLKYNTCESVELQYGRFGNGIVQEYGEYVDFYLNNYCQHSRTGHGENNPEVVTEKIVIRGAKERPSVGWYNKTRTSDAGAVVQNYSETWENGVYTLSVPHNGAVEIRINCKGNAAGRATASSRAALASSDISQPNMTSYNGPLIIEAEDMFTKNTKHLVLLPYFSGGASEWYPEVKGHAGLGFVNMGRAGASLKDVVTKLRTSGVYKIGIKYTADKGAALLNVKINGESRQVKLSKTNYNEWQTAELIANLNAGENIIYYDNADDSEFYIDNVTYRLYGSDEEVEEEEHTFSYEMDMSSVAEGGFPEGWKADDNGTVQEYSNTYGEGPRTFKDNCNPAVIYWRSGGDKGNDGVGTLSYGEQENCRLHLKPGTYTAEFVNYYWYDATDSEYTLEISSLSGTSIAITSKIGAVANPNGKEKRGTFDISPKQTLNFTITEEGDYVAKFTTKGLWKAYVLAYFKITGTYAESSNPSSPTSPTILSALPGTMRPLTKADFKNWDDEQSDWTAIRLGKTIQPGGLIFGDAQSSFQNYLDVSAYDRVYIEGNPNTIVELRHDSYSEKNSNNKDVNAGFQTKTISLGSGGKVEYSLSGITKLNTLLMAQNSGSAVVNNVKFIKGTVESASKNLNDYKYGTYDKPNGTLKSEASNRLVLNRSTNTVYGDEGVPNTRYAVLDGIIRIDFEASVSDKGKTVRVLFNRDSNNDFIELQAKIDEDGKASIDLSNYSTIHLNAIKMPYGVEATFTSVKVVDGSLYKEVPLSKECVNATYTKSTSTCTMSLGESLGPGGVVYGDANVPHLAYADISGYDKIFLTGTPGKELRFIFNRKLVEGPTTEKTAKFAEDGTATLDLTDVKEYAHLHAIKVQWGSDATTVNSVSLYSDTKSDEYFDYYLVGAKNKDEAATTALNDPNACVIDAKFLVGSNSAELVGENPNCLFVLDDTDKTTTEKNVIKESGGTYTANEIELQDGHPFRSPFAVTTPAGMASYKRDLTTKYATIPLPFDLDVAQTGSAKIHVLNKVDGSTMNFKEVKEGVLPAGTIVLYQNDEKGLTTLTGSNLGRTVDGLNIMSTGVDGWYTAQSYKYQVFDDVSTHPELKNYDVYAISNDEFVHAVKKLTLRAFRTVFLCQKSSTGSSAKARLSISITDDTPSDVLEVKGVATELEHYNAAGQRINADSKGLHIFRMSDGTTRKVLVR